MFLVACTLAAAAFLTGADALFLAAGVVFLGDAIARLLDAT
jgi:hypothetical protein